MVLLPLKNVLTFVHVCRKIHLNSILYDKNRQANILRKLLGNRKSGSKKEWYPNEIENNKSCTIQTFNKSLSQGKNAARRVNVLNKLFMTHITDLMTTGEISTEIIGKGIEISRVKVAVDFKAVNVYWIAKGNSDDDIIESTLQRCSGILRHELSQLRLMGEVPKLHFIKDKLYSNLAEVQVILKTCGLGNDDFETKESSSQICKDLHLESMNFNVCEDQKNEIFPKMRHDVLGLDHRVIMDKIYTKMAKSKEAWDLHEKESRNNTFSITTKLVEPCTLRSKETKLKENPVEQKALKTFLLQTKIKNNPNKIKHKDNFPDLNYERNVDEEFVEKHVEKF